MDSNKFYSFYMKGWDEPCLGIIQSIGDEWILIKKITTIYLIERTRNNRSLFLNSYQIHELLANKCYYTNIFRRKFVLIENS